MSSRRPTSPWLVGATFLLLALATLGAIALATSVRAAPQNSNEGKFYFVEDRGCDASWESELNFQDPDSGPVDPPNHLVVIADVVVNGESYVPAWSDPLSVPVPYTLTAADFWDASQPSGTSLYMRIDDRIILPIFDRSGGAGTLNASWSGKVYHFAREDRSGVVKWKLVSSSNITAPPEPECITIHIKKVVTGERADAAQVFTADVNGNTVLGKTLGVPFSATSPATHLLADSEELNPPFNSMTFRVDENLPADWAILGWQVLSGNAACPSAASPVLSTSGAFNNPANWYVPNDPQYGPGNGPIYNTQPGNAVTVCFLNEYVAPRGSLRVEKYADLNGDGDANDPGEGLLPWEVEVSGPGLNGSYALNDSPGVKTFANLFAGDSYTITEATAANYLRTNVTVDGVSQGAGSSAPATIPQGAATVVRFYNQPVGSLLVEKWNDINGNGVEDPDLGEGLIDWDAAISGSNSHADGVWFLHAGSRLFDEVPINRPITVTDVMIPGWSVTNATVNGASIGASSVAGTTVQHGQTTVVRFYNQAKGSILVTKRAVTSHNGSGDALSPTDADGWTITLTSAACNASFARQTDANGLALFEGLPMCTDYVATEGPTNAGSPGFVPVGATSQTGLTPGFGAPLQVTFVNRKTTSDPPCTSGCNQPVVAPSTPPASTATPAASATPSAAPVGPTQDPPSPTSGPASPVTQIAGANTPGPSATPRAPSAGNATVAETSSMGAAIGAGLILVLTGAAALAQAARRR